MIKAPVWTEAQLKEGRDAAIEVFRKRRVEEPLEDYLEAFDSYQGIIENLLESTVDLAELDKQSLEIIKDRQLFHALRYLPGPPISADDLKTVADAVLTPAKLKADLPMAKRIFEVVRNGLDRRRFPWVTEGREPTEAERSAAVLASAAIMAIRKLETNRCSIEKKRQEEEVIEALKAAGLVKVKTRESERLIAGTRGRGVLRGKPSRQAQGGHHRRAVGRPGDGDRVQGFKLRHQLGQAS